MAVSPVTACCGGSGSRGRVVANFQIVDAREILMSGNDPKPSLTDSQVTPPCDRLGARVSFLEFSEILDDCGLDQGHCHFRSSL